MGTMKRAAIPFSYSRLKKKYEALFRRIRKQYRGGERKQLLRERGEEFQAKMRELVRGLSEPPIAG